MPPVTWSTPQCPPRAAWLALSANGQRQWLGGSCTGLASVAVRSYSSPPTLSAAELKYSTASAACSGFDDLAAIARACGGNGQQVESLAGRDRRHGQGSACLLLGRFHRHHEQGDPADGACRGVDGGLPHRFSDGPS